MVKQILLLGDERLYDTCSEVKEDEWDTLVEIKENLHDTMMDFRDKYKCGRAIAAPQIGINKRVIYMCIDKPYIFVNPQLHFDDDEMIEIVDDCMSFPNLLVKVMRYKRCSLEYTDENGNKKSVNFEGDLSELIQHEYDHLDGVLAVMRAKDNKSLIIKK